MKRRETIAMVSGLLVGLLLGLLVLGISPDLREELYGTAAEDEAKSTSGSQDAKSQVNYYLVELSNAQDWLTEKRPELEEDETLGDAVTEIDSLTKSANFRADAQSAKASIDLLLPQMVATLLDTEVATLTQEVKSDVTACLGTNRDDPYAENEPDMYLYLTIPAEREKSVEVPETWEKLDQPKTNDLYWQWLGCYPEKSKIAQ